LGGVSGVYKSGAAADLAAVIDKAPRKGNGMPTNFQPKTSRIERLAKAFPYVVEEFESILDRKTSIYLDYANIRGWSEKLGWHIDLKRLYQLFESFTCPKRMAFYYGTMEGDNDSKELIKTTKAQGYEVTTKPVKRIRISIDASSVSAGSPDILCNFIARPLLKSLSVKQIEELNSHLKTLNSQGVLFFEDLKCNFDVEISTHMLVDMINGVEGFILWSCDGDFADTILKLLSAGLKVMTVGVSGRFAKELNQLQPAGLRFFEVKRLKEFLCWPRELDAKFK
jgi:uncharacterized LabA/DUF88 family protein